MLRRILSGYPHALRALAMALAAFALAWGVAATEGLIAAMVGAVLGVVAGQLLGRSRLRLPVALGAIALFALLNAALGSFATTHALVPHLLGPGTTLRVVSVLRFGVLALSATSFLRTLAVRRPTALALEIGSVAVAITTVFAAHRDGVIARPLWLSDWAWQQGIDPTQVLLAVGVAAVALLAVLLLVETRSGRAFSSLIVLTILGALALVCLNVVGLPRPQPINDLGLTNPPPGEDPRNRGRDGGRGPNNSQPGDAGESEGGQGAEAGSADASDDANGADAGGAGQDAGADASDDGGGAAGNDGGDDAQSSSPMMGDAEVDTGFAPHGESDGGIGEAPPPQGDGGANRPPPASDQLNERDGPSNSPAPMAVVLLDDDYSPPSQAYYFRQEAWSQYNGSRLVHTTRGDTDLDTLDAYPTERTTVTDPPPAAGRTRVSHTVVLLTEHAHPFGLEGPVTFAPAPNPNPDRFVRAYRVESNAQTIDYRRLFGRAAGNPRWSPEVRQYYTTGPSDPRYARLAHEIVDRLPAARRTDPFAQALAIKLQLDHDFTYSTRARHGGEDPTAEFLFGNRIGYCVHFAHAAVFLWRSLGIPARIGTGYHSDEDNRRGGSTIVLRAGDAHAWPELYLDGVGWIVLDIAAARNLDPPGQPQDDELQRLLGQMARAQPPTPGEPPRARRPGERRRSYGRDVGLAGLYLIAAALAFLYAAKLWRRAAPALANPRAVPRVGYRAALDVLAEAGLAREFGETREQFARRAEALAPRFAELTELHLAARFRDPAADPAARAEYDKARWRAALAAFKREVRERARPGRRLLGLINPASWLDSR